MFFPLLFLGIFSRWWTFTFGFRQIVVTFFDRLVPTKLYDTPNENWMVNKLVCCVWMLPRKVRNTRRMDHLLSDSVKFQTRQNFILLCGFRWWKVEAKTKSSDRNCNVGWMNWDFLERICLIRVNDIPQPVVVMPVRMYRWGLSNH